MPLLSKNFCFHGLDLEIDSTKSDGLCKLVFLHSIRVKTNRFHRGHVSQCYQFVAYSWLLRATAAPRAQGSVFLFILRKEKKKPTQNTSHTWVCSASWANTIMHISAFLKKKGRQISVQPLEAIAVTFRLALQRDAGQWDWIWLLVAAPLGTAGEAELRGQNFPLIRGKSPTQMVYRIDYRG